MATCVLGDMFIPRPPVVETVTVQAGDSVDFGENVAAEYGRLLQRATEQFEAHRALLAERFKMIAQAHIRVGELEAEVEELTAKLAVVWAFERAIRPDLNE